MSDQEREDMTEAVAAELLAVLTRVEQGEKAAEERWNRQAQAWTAAVKRWVEMAGGVVERQEQERGALAGQAESLADLTQRQAQVTLRLEKASAPWVWDWSRREWKVLLLSAILSVLVTMVYYELGPVKKLSGELKNLRGVWAEMTPAEQADMNRRIQGRAKATEEKQ